MEKIIRNMDEMSNWLEISKDNYLRIDDIQTTLKNEPYYNNENCILFNHYTDITFNVYYRNKVISSIKQIANSTYFESKQTNKKMLSELYRWLMNYDELRVSQNLFMTYLNNKESKIFNSNIGESILYVKKEFSNTHELIFYEEELSAVENYIFVEGEF